MSDSEIEQWVLNQLGVSPLAGCREVCISSRDGIVTLDGTVPSRRAKLAVQKAARGAKGVVAVVNNLHSNPDHVERHLRGAPPKHDLTPAPSIAKAAAAGAMSTY